MAEEEIEIQTANGTVDSVLLSEGTTRRPGVIHLTDMGGVRPSQRQMARQLAEQGYTVLMPNVFYRTSRMPVFDFPIHIGEERTMKRFAELGAPLSPEAMDSDLAAYVDFLAANKHVSSGPMGVVGYCFSGKMALRAAAVRSSKIAAAASFHGGGLFTDDSTSPHLVLPKIKARLYFGHAINDRSMPEEAIEKLNQALESWGGKFESEIYPDAIHGWTVPDSRVYNPQQAERAFTKLTELFTGTLQ
ncbi:MAG TPA: dienelactone hydrolase family protein [Candidatus Angelobacter sp.]|nr:dienelactone hydrolase family protein [Candidatus Angelobacter sp.]